MFHLKSISFYFGFNPKIETPINFFSAQRQPQSTLVKRSWATTTVTVRLRTQTVAVTVNQSRIWSRRTARIFQHSSLPGGYCSSAARTSSATFTRRHPRDRPEPSPHSNNSSSRPPPSLPCHR